MPNKTTLFYFVPWILLFCVEAQSSYAEDLPLELAQRLSAKAHQYATQKSWKVSVAIVNAEGNLVSFERGDGSYLGSIGSAREKAESANAFRRPTSAFVEAVKSGRTGLLSGKNIVAIEGGVPIIINGKHVGAIGVSGAKAPEDEEVANQALKAILPEKSPEKLPEKPSEKR